MPKSIFDPARFHPDSRHLIPLPWNNKDRDLALKSLEQYADHFPDKADTVGPLTPKDLDRKWIHINPLKQKVLEKFHPSSIERSLRFLMKTIK